MPAQIELPQEQPLLRVTTMPNDANAKGDIFGGWLMSQIDIAGAVVAYERAQGPIATVSVKDLHFENPLYVYDLVSFYGAIETTGKSSISVKLHVYAQRTRQYMKQIVKIANATYIYVAIEKPGVKRELPII